MNKIYFLIGASGSGKTTALKELGQRSPTGFRFFYFDSIGVPPFSQMEKEYGSTDEWQRVKTREWVGKLKNLPEGGNVVLDGQIRPTYIEEACNAESIFDYEIILLDCADGVRKERLIARGHPELASGAMMHWAKYLREACAEGKCKVIDNSTLSTEETLSALMKVLS